METGEQIDGTVLTYFYKTFSDKILSLFAFYLVTCEASFIRKCICMFVFERCLKFLHFFAKLSTIRLCWGLI